jgi:hypothetical protein
MKLFAETNVGRAVASADRGFQRPPSARDRFFGYFRWSLEEVDRRILSNLPVRLF